MIVDFPKICKHLTVYLVGEPKQVIAHMQEYLEFMETSKKQILLALVKGCLSNFFCMAAIGILLHVTMLYPLPVNQLIRIKVAMNDYF